MLTAVGQRELTTHRTEQTPTIIRLSGNPYSKKYDKKFKNHAQRRCNKPWALVCMFFSVQFHEGLGHRRSRPRSWQKTRPPPPAWAFHNQTACNRIRPRGGYSDVSPMRTVGYFSERPWWATVWLRTYSSWK